MKLKIPFGVFVIPIFCMAIIPSIVALTNMSTIISWFMVHGAVSFTSSTTVFIILILAGTGILLILGAAVISRGEDWYLKKTKPPAPEENKPAGIGGFTGIINSLNDSVTRLSELSRVIEEQRRVISRINAQYAHTGDPPPVEVLALLPGREKYFMTEQQSCYDAALPVFPDTGWNAPRSGPDQASLDKAEMTLIYLNQLKLDREFGPCRRDWKKHT
jgi:hypothetical protein